MDDAGMYEEMKKVSGKVQWFVGSLPAQRLADAVLTAIEKDLPEITLMPGLKYASLNFELEEALDGDTVNDVIARLGDAQHLLDRPPQWEDEKKKK
jgi:hypothetical protein